MRTERGAASPNFKNGANRGEEEVRRRAEDDNEEGSKNNMKFARKDDALHLPDKQEEEMNFTLHPFSNSTFNVCKEGKGQAMEARRAFRERASSAPTIHKTMLQKKKREKEKESRRGMASRRRVGGHGGNGSPFSPLSTITTTIPILIRIPSSSSPRSSSLPPPPPPSSSSSSSSQDRGQYLNCKSAGSTQLSNVFSAFSYTSSPCSSSPCAPSSLHKVYGAVVLQGGGGEGVEGEQQQAWRMNGKDQSNDTFHLQRKNRSPSEEKQLKVLKEGSGVLIQVVEDVQEELHMNDRGKHEEEENNNTNKEIIFATISRAEGGGEGRRRMSCPKYRKDFFDRMTARETMPSKALRKTGLEMNRFTENMVHLGAAAAVVVSSPFHSRSNHHYYDNNKDDHRDDELYRGTTTHQFSSSSSRRRRSSSSTRHNNSSSISSNNYYFNNSNSTQAADEGRRTTRTETAPPPGEEEEGTKPTRQYSSSPLPPSSPCTMMMPSAAPTAPAVATSTNSADVHPPPLLPRHHHHHSRFPNALPILLLTVDIVGGTVLTMYYIFYLWKSFYVVSSKKWCGALFLLLLCTIWHFFFWFYFYRLRCQNPGWVSEVPWSSRPQPGELTWSTPSPSPSSSFLLHSPMKENHLEPHPRRPFLLPQAQTHHRCTTVTLPLACSGSADTPPLGLVPPDAPSPASVSTCGSATGSGRRAGGVSSSCSLLYRSFGSFSAAAPIVSRPSRENRAHVKYFCSVPLINPYIVMWRQMERQYYSDENENEENDEDDGDTNDEEEVEEEAVAVVLVEEEEKKPEDDNDEKAEKNISFVLLSSVLDQSERKKVAFSSTEISSPKKRKRAHLPFQEGGGDDEGDEPANTSFSSDTFLLGGKENAYDDDAVYKKKDDDEEGKGAEMEEDEREVRKKGKKRREGEEQGHRQPHPYGGGPLHSSRVSLLLPPPPPLSTSAIRTCGFRYASTSSSFTTSPHRCCSSTTPTILPAVPICTNRSPTSAKHVDPTISFSLLSHDSHFFPHPHRSSSKGSNHHHRHNDAEMVITPSCSFVQQSGGGEGRGGSDRIPPSSSGDDWQKSKTKRNQNGGRVQNSTRRERKKEREGEERRRRKRREGEREGGGMQIVTSRLRYCYDCQLYMPDRSFHCPHCAQCVFMFDHHCNFTNTCIGQNNYKIFFSFLLHSLIHSILSFCGTLLGMFYFTFHVLEEGGGGRRWWHEKSKVMWVEVGGGAVVGGEEGERNVAGGDDNRIRGMANTAFRTWGGGVLSPNIWRCVLSPLCLLTLLLIFFCSLLLLKCVVWGFMYGLTTEEYVRWMTEVREFVCHQNKTRQMRKMKKKAAKMNKKKEASEKENMVEEEEEAGGGGRERRGGGHILQGTSYRPLSRSSSQVVPAMSAGGKGSRTIFGRLFFSASPFPLSFPTSNRTSSTNAAATALDDADDEDFSSSSYYYCFSIFYLTCGAMVSLPSSLWPPRYPLYLYKEETAEFRADRVREFHRAVLGDNWRWWDILLSSSRRGGDGGGSGGVSVADLDHADNVPAEHSSL